MKSSVAIGTLAGEFGLAAHVLRHWEAEGLLRPARDSGGRRRYGDDDRFRVAVIVKARQAGLSLPDIRALFAVPSDRRAIIRRHQDDLKRRMAEIQAAVDFLEGGLRCTHDDFTTCPVFRKNLFPNVS
ncbi:helix-turn-helix domain-containing protein [Herbidospora daliensis]|uniref:helix-turn-helix domain-containing protein n=1 Tax=Herbidospora daliensis TaxID=295585 RepID=UPI000780A59D|nr:MerR family transcriptional regulator [Herbidospora daliensis]